MVPHLLSVLLGTNSAYRMTLTIYIYSNIAKAWVHPGSPVDVSVPNQGIYMTSGRKVGAITMEGESYQLISGPPWIHTDHYLK